MRKVFSQYNLNSSANCSEKRLRGDSLARRIGCWIGAPVTIGLMPQRSSSESSADYDQSGGRGGRILVIVTLVLAVVAVALSGWTLYRLSREGTTSAPIYTGSQRSDAKQKICTAADVVRKGVSLNTNLQPPGGPQDVTGSLAVAANARVALYDGGQYLIARLDPATPPDLADAVKKFANGLMDIGAAATAGAQNSEPEQAARLKAADEANTTITNLCK
jgi:hypothetical protein